MTHVNPTDALDYLALGAAIGFVIWVVNLWIVYAVIKAAVRNGTTMLAVQQREAHSALMAIARNTADTTKEQA